MSQNDFTIANQGFPAFRADLNSALQALASNSSGTSAPSTTFANSFFYDETNKEICKSGLEYALKYNPEKENLIKNNKNKGIFEKFFNLFQKI